MYDTLVNYALIGAKHKIDLLKEEIKNTDDKAKVKRLKAKLKEEKNILEAIKYCEKDKYQTIRLCHTKPRKKMFLRENNITLTDEEIVKLEAYLWDKSKNKVAKLFFEGDDWEKYNKRSY